MVKAKFLCFKLLVVLTPCYIIKETMSLREVKHNKFALFCRPYYLRHGIKIFSDNSLPLDVTVLFWKLKKKNAVKLIFFKSFTFKPEVCSSREMFIVTKWTNQALLSLAFYVQIK